MNEQARRKEYAEFSPAASARRDPLAYRPGPAARAVPVGRPVRRARRTAAFRARNRYIVPPVQLWNARFRRLRNALLLLLVAEVAWLCLTSPLLNVTRVTVSGARIKSPRHVARIAGLDRPSNIFLAPTGKATRAVAALPEVESVRIERRLPRTLSIAVRERQPLASVMTNNGTWVVDRTGLVFRRVPAPLAGKPVLVASASGRAELGRHLPLTARSAALKCLAQMPNVPAMKAARLHVDKGNQAWMQCANGLKIRLGPLDDAPERLRLTGRLLRGPDGPRILARAAVLDMTTPQNEVYKPREDGEDSRLKSVR